MPTIASHTLGCKVNQYDTEAMMELFRASGYHEVPLSEAADIYLINTCTVTGTGDRKSLQLARRLKREHPDSLLILCGCMAQYQSDKLFEAGADLILGTQRRGEVVSLTEAVLRTGQRLCAVTPLTEGLSFEPLRISTHSGHTRATLKIQEGCDNHCAYCIIPQVRGPIRSRPLSDISDEAIRLRDAGYRELVLTGIHLSSYGRDSGSSLAEVIHLISGIDGILRLRLGSLEPTVVTREFAELLRSAGKVCPQFHLALQSGSNTVLARMRRRYNISQYLAAVRILRGVFDDPAITTDILTGFPGETEAEFEETARIIREVGFARIHVFPYSPRPDTPAAAMPGQLSSREKEQRARKLIRIGEEAAMDYMQGWIGKTAEVLPEEQVDGRWEGYTPEYIRVSLSPDIPCVCGDPVQALLHSARDRKICGTAI